MGNMASGFRDVCHAMRSVGTDIVTQLSALREENAKHKDDIVLELRSTVQELRANLQKLNEIADRIRGTEQDSDQEGEDGREIVRVS